MTGTTTEQPPPPVPPTPEAHRGPATPPPRRRRRASWRVLAVFALLAAALVFLLVEGLGSSLDYFDTVNQAMAHRQTLGTQTFRLEGTLVPSTLHATATGSDFSICQGSNVVHVVNTGSPPELLNGTVVPVVVVGHFVSTTSDEFESNSILIKHSSTYTAQHPGRVKAQSGPAC